jgi:hypothetical protein
MKTWVLLPVAATGAVLLGAPQPWRLLVVAAFVTVGPGLAVLPLLPGTDRLTRAALAVGVSAALAAVLSEALAIAGIFSATALVLVLTGVSAVGGLLPGGAR